MKILMIDDDIDRIELFQKYLNESEFSSFVNFKYCDSADKARVLCKNNKYDILILDVCLPKKIGMKETKQEGLNLLKDLSTKRKYLLPNRIIGITAEVNYLEDFRREFIPYACTVLSAPRNDHRWVFQIIDIIKNTVDSSINENLIEKSKMVISIHGIRTTGKWQDQFSTFIDEKTKNLEYHSFKYGFFGLFIFLIPILRYYHAKSFYKKIDDLIKENEDKEIYIFAHSYGTYIISKLLEKTTFDKKIRCLFFCGSVMPSTYDIRKNFNRNIEFMINDCGINDYILILSRIFVPFLGDAGRIGFESVNNEKIRNRFFKGGHSLYFERFFGELHFIEKFWLPYILDSKSLESVDERNNSGIKDDIIEGSIFIFKFILVVFLIMMIVGLFTDISFV